VGKECRFFTWFASWIVLLMFPETETKTQFSMIKRLF
jgi:hypothetical protein